VAASLAKRLGLKKISLRIQQAALPDRVVRIFVIGSLITNENTSFGACCWTGSAYAL
jgi:hypothetical protein